MYTQCPQCLTIYRVEGEEIAAAQGSVRCVDCASVFDALPTLTAQLPPEPIERLPLHRVQADPPQLATPILRPSAMPLETIVAQPPRARERITPAFARRRRRVQTQRNGRWLAACAVLALTLGAQIAWSQRTNWIDDTRVRGLLDSACARLGCRLPLRHDGATLELLSRDIQPHPSVPGALIISATLRNDASFAQAYPTVEVSLSDLDDKPVAMRRFQPGDYLTDAHAIRQGIAAGASASLVFEVADPGKNAVAFEFKFE